VPSLLYTAGVLAVLVGLFFWARHRARHMREQASEREQTAMAVMLAGRRDASEAAGAPELPAAAKVLPKPVGRLLEADPADKAASAQREAARIAKEEGRRKDLPPLDLEAQPPREATPAEKAAADLDPIEDLISQIMVDEPEPRPAKKQPVRPRASERSVYAPSEPVRKTEPAAAGVPLRELVLAWYEARGYRGSPASPAVWPIELVLRHRNDAARAYAFVVQNDHISVDRITALIEQAREIGMMRVAVVAEAGYERGAKEVARKRSVRLIDRMTMEAELAELELPTAAKIIAVARTRASPEASTASA
jgi:hypothetical protein